MKKFYTLQKLHLFGSRSKKTPLKMIESKILHMMISLIKACLIERGNVFVQDLDGDVTNLFSSINTLKLTVLDEEELKEYENKGSFLRLSDHSFDNQLFPTFLDEENSVSYIWLFVFYKDFAISSFPLDSEGKLHYSKTLFIITLLLKSCIIYSVNLFI